MVVEDDFGPNLISPQLEDGVAEDTLARHPALKPAIVTITISGRYDR